MVVVKYMFQFGFFPWNSAFTTKLNEDKPFFPARIMGVEKTDNYIRYDLLQLLVLFFHRSLLQVGQPTSLDPPPLLPAYQGLVGPCWTMLGLVEPCWVMLSLVGLCWAMLSLFGPC